LGLLANRYFDILGVTPLEIFGVIIVALEGGGALGMWDGAGDGKFGSPSVSFLCFDLFGLGDWNFCFGDFRLTPGLVRFDIFLTPWTKDFFTMDAVGTADNGDGKVVEVMPWALIERLRASASWLASSCPSRIKVVIRSRCKRSCVMRFCWIDRMCSNSCQKLKLISAELRVISLLNSWANPLSLGTSSLLMLWDIVRALYCQNLE